MNVMLNFFIGVIFQVLIFLGELSIIILDVILKLYIYKIKIKI